MGINASIKRNEVYIDNKLFFKIHRSDVWFGKEKCKLLDPLGNVLLYCRIKYPFYGAAKFDVIQNNINTIYTLVYTKKDLFWDVQGTKYHVKKKAFSFRRDFFRNEELIGTTDKKNFRVSHLDEINFSFTTDNIEEVELCLLLFVIHSTLFNNDE